VRWRSILAAVAAALVVIGPSVARSSDSKPPPAASKKAPPRRVLRPDELKVEGNVQRPKATSITPPPIAITGGSEPESFLPKILEALRAEPF
jgi:hypothetical protein